MQTCIWNLGEVVMLIMVANIVGQQVHRAIVGVGFLALATKARTTSGTWELYCEMEPHSNQQPPYDMLQRQAAITDQHHKPTFANM